MDIIEIREKIEKDELQCKECQSNLESLCIDIHGSVYSICDNGHVNIFDDKSKGDEKFKSSYYGSLSMAGQAEFTQQWHKDG